MPYLHCARCRRTAWLHATAETAMHCPHCDAPLTPMPAGEARSLARAVRARFARDAQHEAGRRRFVRG